MKEEMNYLKEGKIIFPHLKNQDLSSHLSEDRPITCFIKSRRNMNTAILENRTTEGGISPGFDMVHGSCLNHAAVRHILGSFSDDSVHNINILGLLKSILLKMDDRYIITSNLDTSDGLVRTCSLRNISKAS